MKFVESPPLASAAQPVQTCSGLQQSLPAAIAEPGIT
jgi:hypothetical protein